MFRTSSFSDIADVAHCHSAAFPSSLSSALGKTYVRHMLTWYLSTNKTFLFHIIDEHGLCAGYCGGIINDGTLGTGSASGMAQHSFYQAIWAFITHPYVVFHPEVRAKWPVLWKNIKMRLGLWPKIHSSPEQRREQATEPQIGLVVIGVDPKYQGKGYGTLLLKEFERRAVEDFGINHLHLTVRSNNIQAIRAYERNGWVKNKESSSYLQMLKTIS